MTPPAIRRTVLWIVGMKGNACREAVMAALEATEGTIEVEVSLIRGSASVVHDGECEASDLIRAIVRAGYGAAVRRSGSEGSHIVG